MQILWTKWSYFVQQTVLSFGTPGIITNYPCCTDWNQLTISQPCVTSSVPVFILLSLFNIWYCSAAALMKSLKSIQGWHCHRASQVNKKHFVENEHRHSLDLSASLNLKSSLVKAREPPWHPGCMFTQQAEWSVSTRLRWPESQRRIKSLPS